MNNLLEECLLKTSEQLKPYHFSEKVVYGDVTVTEQEWDVIGLQKAVLSRAIPIIKKQVELEAYKKGLEDGEGERTREIERAKKAERERMLRIFASFGKIQLEKPLSGKEFEALFEEEK